MQLGILRLFLAAFWFVAAFGIYYRQWFAPAAWNDNANFDLAVILAVALGVWNIVRFFTFRQPRLVEKDALASHPEPERPEEYNPELDFSKQRPQPPQG
ncbi:MAG: hypothetical protein LC104_20200 [Bacteroidales bacterium]|nr:hypothetical protein [Bacteroidales bacterium]